ncbi:MAG TPA: UDP-N-acetyl-D-mannosamine dehydrogenase [Gemmataceae bacterium]|nr:UDP-N-acetyl-D-mannosamine dehydrogenase [Gemmataceae bacterium]
MRGNEKMERNSKHEPPDGRRNGIIPFPNGRHPSRAAFQKVGVIGLGYIGLPTAAMFARSGLQVIGVDVNARVVETVNCGKAHVVEPDLDELVKSVTASGLLRASTQPEPADAFIIAVGTPCRADHRPDVSYVEAAARAIAPVLQPGNLVVLESTSPVGTTEQVAQWLADCRPDLSFPQQAGEHADVQVAHCPERVLPGRMLIELVQNARIIGGLTPYCARRAAELYQTFVEGECLITDARTAELAKLAENSYRDVNIALANELSIICARLGIDVWELIAVTNRHPRVNILQPGPGVGGHCIAVDPWFIVAAAPEEARLIRTAREVNDAKPFYVIEEVRRAASRQVRPVIACLGLTYKANTDDLRESPALHITAELAAAGVGRVLAVEPHIQSLAGTPAASAELTDVWTALRQANVVVLLVDHDAFAEIGPEALEGKEVIDTRGLWRRQRPAPQPLRLAA